VGTPSSTLRVVSPSWSRFLTCSSLVINPVGLNSRLAPDLITPNNQITQNPRDPSILDHLRTNFSASQPLVPRLRLGTHCRQGSASICHIKPTESASQQAEPALSRRPGIPKGRPGTRLCSRHTCSHQQPTEPLKFLELSPYLIICAKVSLPPTNDARAG
jgi:hypothetical protein